MDAKITINESSKQASRLELLAASDDDRLVLWMFYQLLQEGQGEVHIERANGSGLTWTLASPHLEVTRDE